MQLRYLYSIFWKYYLKFTGKLEYNKVKVKNQDLSEFEPWTPCFPFSRKCVTSKIIFWVTNLFRFAEDRPPMTKYHNLTYCSWENVLHQNVTNTHTHTHTTPHTHIMTLLWVIAKTCCLHSLKIKIMTWQARAARVQQKWVHIYNYASFHLHSCSDITPQCSVFLPQACLCATCVCPGQCLHNKQKACFTFT